MSGIIRMTYNNNYYCTLYKLVIYHNFFPELSRVGILVWSGCGGLTGFIRRLVVLSGDYWTGPSLFKAISLICFENFKVNENGLIAMDIFVSLILKLKYILLVFNLYRKVPSLKEVFIVCNRGKFISSLQVLAILEDTSLFPYIICFSNVFLTFSY